MKHSQLIQKTDPTAPAGLNSGEKRHWLAVLCAATCPLLGACATHYVSSSTESSKGLVTHVEGCGEGAVAATPHGRVGVQKGVATRHCVLSGLVVWGSTGAGIAAQNGNILEVDTVQHGKVRVLWGLLYANDSTAVTGEAGLTCK